MWDLWWTKWRWGRFSPSTSVSLSIFIPSTSSQSPLLIIWGWYNRPVVAVVPRDPVSPPLRIKKNTVKERKKENVFKTPEPVFFL
jgi:hypothetical protein